MFFDPSNYSLHFAPCNVRMASSLPPSCQSRQSSGKKARAAPGHAGSEVPASVQSGHRQNFGGLPQGPSKSALKTEAKPLETPLKPILSNPLLIHSCRTLCFCDTSVGGPSPLAMLSPEQESHISAWTHCYTTVCSSFLQRMKNRDQGTQMSGQRIGFGTLFGRVLE